MISRKKWLSTLDDVYTMKMFIEFIEVEQQQQQKQNKTTHCRSMTPRKYKREWPTLVIAVSPNLKKKKLK